ncbi:hypothetical protein CASFOL_005310 [Castilleja foliolosa]|uniref:Uncharacterized protein n=1 Tax=Castilleja foliolosa TaxID=1961234 RepID=A0ABD3E535_9LAMI
MEEIEMCYDSTTTDTTEKRRISTSPTQSPNTKRRQISVVSDTQLVNVFPSNDDETLDDVSSNDDETSEEVSSNVVHDGSDVYESIIDYLVLDTDIENIACKIKSGSVLGNILEDLLKSVRQHRGSLHEDCEEHFKLVNMAWEDNELISLLLKEKYMICDIETYYDESNKQLRESLTPLIKDDSPMKDILRESRLSSVRGALALLIGYFSARNMTLGFDDIMGRRGAVGIYTVRYSYSQDDIKVEPTSASEGGAFMKPPSSYTLQELLPDTSLISELRNDESFNNAAQEIQCDSEVAMFADDVVTCISCRETPKYQPRKVFLFWRDKSLMHLRRALKKSTNLRNIFKILSDGSQMLRLKERLDRIRRDSFLKSKDFDESDFALKMRVALSILIGYWSAYDVAQLALHILYFQYENPTKADLLKDLSDVEVICYFVDSYNDLEGLKNVLASKYAKDSLEFTSRVVEIEHHQKLKVAEAARDRGYDNREALITAILKKGRCIAMHVPWFSFTRGMSSDV